MCTWLTERLSYVESIILINYPHETWKIKEINFDKTGDGELKRGYTPWIKIQQLALYIILVYSKVYD